MFRNSRLTDGAVRNEGMDIFFCHFLKVTLSSVSSNDRLVSGRENSVPWPWMATSMYKWGQGTPGKHLSHRMYFQPGKTFTTVC